MSESEAIKMTVVLVFMAWIAVVLLAGWIIEEVRNYKARDWFKDKDAQAILKKVNGNE